MKQVTKQYNQTYEKPFQECLEYARKFMPEIKPVIQKLFGCSKIIDNEGTNKDQQKGEDLTCKCKHDRDFTISVRVRKNKYIKYDQYTEDDYEKENHNPDWHFYGYADKKDTKLESYIIFLHKDFKKGKENGSITRVAYKQNKKYSLVKFSCYPLHQIADNCTNYRYGKIGYKQ